MNDFQILSKLGEGAYSTVLKVRRLYDGNIYALKKVKLLKLSTKEKTNALNEVRILASIKSNFVISYKEAFYDESENILGIVMEYADKGDLYQKITENKKTAKLFEESEIWRILIQLIKGLKSLHDLKILHRDLKSANVFLFSNGSAKLGDLNVSKVAKKGLLYTQTGTPYYASPEVWKDQPYNYKSDIWSLGCVLYEMITLHPPFKAQNMEGLYLKVTKGQYNKIPNQFSSDLSNIIQLLLQVDPDKRPSCDLLLKNNIIQKRIQFFKNYCEDLSEDQALLKTIVIPKNLMFLGGNLPGPNYIRKKNNFERKEENQEKNKEDNNNKDNNNDNNKDNNNEVNNNNENNNNNEDNNKDEEDEEEKERLRIEKEREEKQKRREKIDLERKKRLQEEREKRERREKLEQELKLRKELEEQEREKEINKYNIITRNKKDDVSKDNRINILRNLSLNNSNVNKHYKINLPDIRNSYDNPSIVNLNLNLKKQNYNGYNRSKKYKLLLNNEEEEMNRLIKNYAPSFKEPINKKYIYAQNKLIHNSKKKPNLINPNNYLSQNQRYMNLGIKLNPISQKILNNNMY